MKILTAKYPKGSFKDQKTDGRYIDGFLYSNLKILAERIPDDMTFLGVCFSSTLEVGTGKSALCTQIGEAWSEIMKEVHGLDIPFTQDNVVFRPEDLIERAFKVPKYSFILLDEWEDASYWSALSMTLRKFFRKCRQLNLFIMVIIPNFFQLPLGYAISRSVFGIDVKFDENFHRGNYDFYNFKSKKDLYIYGKKFHNYSVTRPTFQGEFMKGYGVPEKEYRRIKMADMMRYDEDEKKPEIKEIDIKAREFAKVYTTTKKSVKEVASWFGVSRQTGFEWLKKERVRINETVPDKGLVESEYNNLQIGKNDVGGEEESGDSDSFDNESEQDSSNNEQPPADVPIIRGALTKRKIGAR